MREFIFIGIIILVGSLYLGTAHAQIYQNDQDLSKIVGGAEKNCTNVDIIGSQATTPFYLELVFDPTGLSSITETHTGIAKPVYQKSNQVLLFYTNDTAEYYVTAKLSYPNIDKRDVFERYTSQPNNVFQQDLQYYDSKFCRIYHIVTQAPIHIQTREEILGQDILNVPKTLQDLVDTQKYNTKVEIGTFASIEIMILIVLIAIVVSIFIYAATMRQNRKLKIQSTESYKTLRKMGEDQVLMAKSIKETLEDTVGKIDKKLWELGGFMEHFKTTSNIKSAESSVKVEEKKPETHPKGWKERLIHFYDTNVKLDDMSLKGLLKSFSGKTDEESKAKKEMIEEELKKRRSAENNRVTEVGTVFEKMGEQNLIASEVPEFEPSKLKEYSDEVLYVWYRKYNTPTEIANRDKLVLIHDELTQRRSKKTGEKHDSTD